MTHEIFTNSPAIDAGGVRRGAIDQRGFTRPLDGNKDGLFASDIGAYEAGIDNINRFLSVPIMDQKTSNNTAGCPDGFVGQFSFTARFTNDPSVTGAGVLLSRLVVEVETLTNGNLLSNADGGAGGAGARLTVKKEGQYSDGLLTQDEFVDVPFTICLRDKNKFNFTVHVFGDYSF